MDRSVFVDKTELTHTFDCEGSWGGLLFTGVARVKGVGTASILMSEGVHNLSAQLKWASTGSSSGASMILVFLLTVLKQFRNSGRKNNSYCIINLLVYFRTCK